MSEQDIEKQLYEVVVRKDEGTESSTYARLCDLAQEKDKEAEAETSIYENLNDLKANNPDSTFPVDKCTTSETNIKATDQTKASKSGSDDMVNLPVTEVIYKFRDINKKMVDCWAEAFRNHTKGVKVSLGDIFKGAPAADAVVSPANSFGFMDGGIDMVFSQHFGWQMQERLQKVIHEEYDGEILVGQAAIIPTFPDGTPEVDTCKKGCNEDRPIKYLISAPTMRVPLDVMDTANAYLAFRAIILAVRKHNRNPANKDSQIKSVLCPGLGTAVGRMPPQRCAKQMLEAYTAYELGLKPGLIMPKDLGTVWTHHTDMAKFVLSNEEEKQTCSQS